MKKLFKNFLMLTAVGAMAFLYSCSEEDEPTAAAPSISVSAALADGTVLADGGSVITGNDISVTVTATTPGGFNVIRATAGGATTEVTRNDLQLDAGATSGTAVLTVETPEEQVGSTIDWTFTIVDDLNQTGETTFSYTVAEVPSPDANTGMNTLYGQLNAQGGSFYDLMNDAVYGYAATRDEQTANVDFAFFYGSTSGYAIAALADESLQTAFEAADIPIDGIFDAGEFNETLFKALEATAEDFDGVVSEADLTNLFGEVAADATVANNLEVGSVFGFSLDGEKRQGLSGLMKVTETGGDSGASRTISFEIKYTSPVQ
ncbi:MAG: hypothetical protein R8G66_32830 [Cytophagales bacterium]|nr:hypothetical protein [Cytophagales bacterium]